MRERIANPNLNSIVDELWNAGPLLADEFGLEEDFGGAESTRSEEDARSIWQNVGWLKVLDFWRKNCMLCFIEHMLKNNNFTNG